MNQEIEKYKNKVIHADCFDILPKLPAESIAACITDPPYNYEFIGRNWDQEEIQRRTKRISNAESSTLVKNIPYGSGLAGGVRNKKWYERNRNNILEYRAWCEKWAALLYEVLKPGALTLVFNSTRTCAHIQVSLESAGFYARDILVWRRHSGIPKGLNFARKLESKGELETAKWVGWHSALRNEWEGIVVVQKPLINNYLENVAKYGVGLFHAEDVTGSFRSNIIDHISRNRKADTDHPTAKPLELMKYLIDLILPQGKEMLVIDPFAGTGSTLLAAKSLGRSFIGIEREEQYVKTTQRKLDSLIVESHQEISLFKQRTTLNPVNFETPS